MTKLTKVIKRNLPAILPKSHDLTISLIPGGWIGFREKGSRREYRLPVMTAYRMAVDSERKYGATKQH